MKRKPVPRSHPAPRREGVQETRSSQPFLLRLFEPVDVASIAFFRAAFGLLMLWHVLQYVVGGRLERLYLGPIFFFKYPGFEWVERASPGIMKLIFLAMAVSALLIAVGLAYRAACAVFFLGHSYMLFLDASQYQNHLYLISLVAFLMILIPAHRAFSLDAVRDRRLRSDVVPAWCLWLLRLQLGIPYFYGGLAKLNPDWLLRAQPMRLWLQQGTEGGIRLQEAWAAYAFSWGGMAYDLLVIPALLWRRTRIPALIVTVLFHVTNSELFSIGVFPWLMLAALALYLPPSWPRRTGLFDRSLRDSSAKRKKPPAVQAQPPARQGLVLAFLAAWSAVQLLVPFRHFLYPGNVDWNERGHRFSWRMKLRDKRGDIHFIAVDPVSGKIVRLNDLDAVITPGQRRMMEHDPEMMRQLAHLLARRLREAGFGDLEVRVDTSISFNGRPKQPLIVPGVALSRIDRTVEAAVWIEPLRD